MTDTTNAANSSPITAECAANMPNEWAPKRIWLQRGVGEGGSHTWCEDSQEPEHEEASYIREDFAGTLSTDYLSGHQDGLDWAALVVEYTDPRTGDWMYDDPHDLAKAIRKGPDMSVYQSAPSAPQQGGDGLRRDQEAAYNSIDRFLRNNLCDEDYAQYSAELYSLLAAPRQPGEMGAGDDTQVVLRWIMSQAESAKEPCGDDPESAAAVRNAKLAAIANAAAQALGLVRGPSYADAEAQCNPNDICAGCRCKYSMAASAQQDEREAKPLTRFVTYLNEHCIGQTITEESLTDWMLDVMDNTPREEPKHPQKSKGLFASSAQQVQADAGAGAGAIPTLTDPDDCDAWCPRCNGSGEETVMSDNGPDAYEQTINCQHCDGKQTLYHAYAGVVRELAQVRKAQLETAAKQFVAKHTRKFDHGRWIQDNYHDHPNITSLVCAMNAAERAAMSREQSQEKGGERG